MSVLPPPTRSPLFGIALLIAGGIVLTAVDASVKLLSPAMPAGQVMAIRGAVTLACIMAVIARERGLPALRSYNLRDQLIRACCFIAGSFLFLEALWRLPLAEANALGFLSPVIVTVLAPIILKERIGWQKAAAVALGFAGVLLIVRPSPSGIRWEALFPLCAAFTSALADILTRRLSATDSAITTLFYTTTAVMVAGLLTWPFGWPVLDTLSLAVIIGIGFFTFIAHWLIVESFRYGEAATLVPFKYFMLLWAVIIGYIGWGEVPDLWTTLGAIAIVGAGLLLFRVSMKR